MSDSAPHTGSFRSIRIATWGAVVGAVVFAISALSGISAFYADQHKTVVTYHTPSTRLLAVAMVPLQLAFAYGVYRRALMAWRTGFVLIAALLVYVVASAWIGTAGAPTPMRLIFVLAAAVIGGLMIRTPYGWWLRQRPYFDDDVRPV